MTSPPQRLARAGLLALCALGLTVTAAPGEAEAFGFKLRLGYPIADSSTLTYEANAESQDIKASDDSGLNIDAIVTFPVFERVSAGVFLQYTAGRAYSINQADTPLGGNFGLGSTVAVDAIVDIDAYTNRELGVYVGFEAFGGVTAVMPADELDAYQRTIGDEGTAAGYNFGAGPNFTYMFNSIGVGVMLDMYAMYESVTLADNGDGFALKLSGTRYFLGFGLAL